MEGRREGRKMGRMGGRKEGRNQKIFEGRKEPKQEEKNSMFSSTHPRRRNPSRFLTFGGGGGEISHFSRFTTHVLVGKIKKRGRARSNREKLLVAEIMMNLE